MTLGGKVHRHVRWRSSGVVAALALVIGLGAAPASAHSPTDLPTGARATEPMIEPQVYDELTADGATTFWVYLHEEPNLADARHVPDRASQGRLVHERLTESSAASQAGLTTLLDAYGADYQAFWIVNAVQVTGDQQLLTRVAQLPEVAQVTADRVYELPEPIQNDDSATVQSQGDGPEWGIDAINAPQVWDQFNATGEGIVVGTIDSGVEFDHPALVKQYRGNLGNGEFDHNYNWHDPTLLCGNPSLEPCDNMDHGTHVTGTIVGDDGEGNQIGVAPDAQWIAAKGCEGISCSQQALLSSGQFMLAPTDLNGENPDPDLRPHVVNNSWGGAATNDPWYASTVQAWVAAGIFPQFANGNTAAGVAPCNSASHPGSLPESYAAGAFDVNSDIADFSNRGGSTFGDGLIKPDIAAPGVAVRSAIRGHDYEENSGTSMASPHVAGAVALMWSAAPNLTRDVLSTQDVLNFSAVSVSDTSCGGTAEHNNVWGHGKLDAFAAVDKSPHGAVGTLSGSVTDATDSAPIAEAAVTVTGETIRHRTTADDGTYEIILPVGNYEVSADAFAYEPQTRSFTIAEDQETRQDVPLERPGGARLQLSSDTIDLEAVPVNTTSDPQGVTLTSVSGEPITFIDVSEPDSGFHAAGGNCGPAPFTLSHLESCTLDYAFSPTMVGEYETTVTLTSNAIDSPHTVSLEGVATGPEANQLWKARYDGPTNGPDQARDLAVSPDGARVYVAGYSQGHPVNGRNNRESTTVAYDAHTGEKIWEARYTEPAERNDALETITVSPDGSSVYVTGYSVVTSGLYEIVAIAYDADTGEKQWISRYDGIGSGTHNPRAMDLSPDGSLLYIAGNFTRPDAFTSDFGTIAFDTETGDKQWDARYQGPGDGANVARTLAVSPDGSQLYVAGGSDGIDSGSDYATVAYDATTGEELWVARYDGPASDRDVAWGLAVSPDSLLIYVTGESTGSETDLDYATIAYHAETGEQEWVARYDGPAGGSDVPNALGLSPDGSLVYVTGESTGLDNRDFATVAYEAETGEKEWVARFNGPGNDMDIAHDLDISPDGSEVVVTGQSWYEEDMDYATVSYDAATGAEQWVAFYDGPGPAGILSGVDIARAVKFSPDGATVFVTGRSRRDGTLDDWATVAYQAPMICNDEVAGTHPGPLVVTSGVTCLANGAEVTGSVHVHDGAGLIAGEATITGAVTASNAAGVQLVGTTLNGPVTIRGTTEQITLSDNQIGGPVRVADNTTNPAPIVVSGNTISGPLTCTGNNPAPVDEGDPNIVEGRVSGQCDQP